MADDEEFVMSDPEGEPTNSDWANARQKFKDVNTAKATAEENLAAKEREVAFLKAGINPDDERMAYFVKGYSGEIDPTKIRETAIKDGFLTDTPPPDPARAQAAATQAAIDAASSGGVPPDADAIAGIDEAYAKGGEAGLEEHMRAAGVPIRYSS